MAFFYSFHFRSFFGSIFLGAIFLIIFSGILIYNLKNIFFKSSKENILIFIILSAYFLTICYSLIHASVISPKYIIFILPLLIIWIILKIENLKLRYKNFFILVILLLNFGNSYLNYKNNPIDRPPTKKILKIISSSNINNIYTVENIVFNNFIKTHKIFNEKKLQIKKVKNYNSEDTNFWFVCLNNPRFALGDNNFPEQEKCKFFEKRDNFVLKKEIKIVDYIIRQYENKI